MFRYEFMIIAFIAAMLLGAIFPLLGSTAVYKRLSSSGDALAHSSLAGVAIGLVAGINPLWISILACVVSFLIIGFLRKKFSKYAEIGVVVVLSAGIATAGILSSYTTSANLDSYLFGSILLLSYEELYAVIGLLVFTLAFVIIFYRRMLHLLYSEAEARVASIHVNLLDLIHSLLFSLAVAIGAKAVGSLIVSSMLVLPVASAMLFKRGYRFTLIAATIISMLTMGLGITLSYYLDLKPGATSVAVAVAILVLLLGYRGVLRLMLRKKHRLESK